MFAERLTPLIHPMLPAIAAASYYGAERHEEAIEAAKAAIEVNQREVAPFLILAASNVALNNAEEAGRAAQKVLEREPKFNLAEFADSQPYKDQRQLNRLLDQLRYAGLS
jgi:tetratricopeptide (TPR) repeat protein